MLELLGLQGLMAPQGLLVLQEHKAYLESLESSAKGERKVKVVCLEWTAFLDLLVLRVHQVHQEFKDTLDLLVFLVKLDFQANLESLENLDFLVKTAWMVFLEMMVPWDPGENVEQMVFLENLDPRVMRALQDPGDLQGRGVKLVHLVNLVLMESGETEVYRVKEDRKD